MTRKKPSNARTKAEPVTAVAERPQRKPKYSRLTQAQVNSIFALTKAGHTQTQIAHTLGCDVSSVCRWLQTLTDTTATAAQRLRASADSYVERLNKTNHAPTMLEVLRDLGVSEKKAPAGEQRGGVNVFIGIKDADVQVSLTPPVSPSDSDDLHRLTVDTTSVSV